MPSFSERYQKVQSEIAEINREGGQLRNLSFVASGHMSKGAQSTKSRLVNKLCGLIDKENTLKILVAIEQRKPLDDTFFQWLVNCSTFQGKCIGLYRGRVLSRLAVGNKAELILEALNRKHLRFIKKQGLFIDGERWIIGLTETEPFIMRAA